MGRGGRPPLAARRPQSATVGWRGSETPDYDSAFYQAFHASTERGPLSARVYAPLASPEFTVEIRRGAEWACWRISDATCSCYATGGCEHRDLLALARARGLRSQRLLDAGSFVIRRTPPGVALRAARTWPPEVGPRVAFVHGAAGASSVRLHESGEHPVFILDSRTCSCRQARPCLHRQLAALAFSQPARPSGAPRADPGPR